MNSDLDDHDLFGAADAKSPTGDDFLIVGVGASAGGVQALQQFFANVPADSGMAYVVILHLSPDHESHLAEILQHAAAIPVRQVSEPVKIEPNCVYVVAPNRSLTMNDGQLSLSDITHLEERRAPIDIFFRKLADLHHSRAVSVVLSGTGADGSMGMKRVKEYGGICLVQEPTEAQHADMPRHCIATGLVDYILPVGEMPAKIIAYRDSLGQIVVPLSSAAQTDADEHALREIFTQLRVRTGHDFSNYKRSTILQRIGRRIGVHGLPDLAAYAVRFRDDPNEARALLKDLLISVTNFFRDPGSFAVLQQTVVPKLFAEKGPEDHVRVWVAGCATGEEAYTLAMLLAEHADPINGPKLQVFATDIDLWALSKARTGYYTLNDAADVSPERLRRFFVQDDGGYRICREIREMVLFAEHNVLKDPPFSHLDLVTCRNLLIYLNRGAQQRALEIFHFALNPGGYLLLGTSESTEAANNLFVLVEKESHIYQSRPLESRPSLPLPTFTAITTSGAAEGRRGERRPPERLSYQDFHQRLLERLAPPSVVINEEHDILHLSERAGRYLQVAAGEPSNNLLKMIRPELRLELRTALFQSLQNRANVEVRGLAVEIDGLTEHVNLIVRPVLREDDATRGLIVVLFEPANPPPATERVEISAVASSVEPIARHLEDELLRLKAQLRSNSEQHELQQQEMKASNEELQAINEELRSSTEELETSKEELQSVNEELNTVNQELKVKVDELSQSNSNFKNLIVSTDIGTIFLDRGLRIRLFTPRVRDLFNLIAGDAGRPLSDITNRLKDKLLPDVEQVLDNLQTIEREVQTVDGRWYLMRVLPYRTPDDHIDGIVLTFLDITLRRGAQLELQQGEERLRSIMESISEYGIITMDANGVIDGWNAGAQNMFYFTEQEALGRPAAMLFTPEDRAAQVPEKELLTARTQGRALDERWHIRKNASLFFASGVLTPLHGSPSPGFVKVVRDLTAKKRDEELLRRAHDELEARVAERTQALRAANEELQAQIAERQRAEDARTSLLRRLSIAQEEERHRISRELHDEMGQLLAGLILNLRAMESAVADNTPWREQLQHSQALADQISREIHELALQLRPTSLDDLGLQTALPQYLETWSSRCSIPAKFHSRGFEGQRLSPTVETVFYRVAQEALTNIAKHAQASRVNVVLERRDGEVALIVEDNGQAFDVEQVLKSAPLERRLGLTGMRERLGAIGGTLEIESVSGAGTTVFATVPLANES